MKKNILNEELGRIKSLMGESKPNSNVEINEDIISLYRKFDITLNERTIEVLSNGMINEQGIGEKISTAFKNIGWSNDALDWLIWERAEGSKNWKTVKTLAEVKALMIATDVGAPSEAFEQSYAVGALMYEWLIGTYGFEGYKKVINEFASESSFGQAVQNALGVKKEDLYDQMAEYVFQSYQRVYKP